jgi:hypothetical protein
MNRNQKIVIIVGLIIIVLMGLFPPWTFHYDGNEYTVGYKFITQATGPVKIDESRLLIQWFCVCIVVGGLVLILKDKGEK